MSRKTWVALAILVVVVLGGWLTSSFGPTPGSTAPAPPVAGGGSGETTADPRRTLPAPGGEPADPVSGLPWIGAAELPPQAHDVLHRIDAGGPFKYDKDGATFGNFEGLLPSEPRGYYKEYTVDTPGSPDRGARRIVTGDRDRIRYWTDDHYESFARIRR